MKLYDIINFLKGKKTYITVFLFIIFNLASYFNIVSLDSSLVTSIDAILGAFGLSFLRAGIKTEVQQLAAQIIDEISKPKKSKNG